MVSGFLWPQPEWTLNLFVYIIKGGWCFFWVHKFLIIKDPKKYINEFEKSVKRLCDALTALERYYKNTPFLLNYIKGAREELAPRQNLIKYYERVKGYQDIKYSIPIRPVAPQKPPLPGEKFSVLAVQNAIENDFIPQPWVIDYHGLKNIDAAKETNNYLMFVNNHQGANALVPNLQQKISGLVMFTHGIIQYDKDKFTAPLKYDKFLALSKIAKMLEEKGMVLFSFDGYTGKRNLKYNLFGVDFFFPRGVIYMLKQYSPAFLPVTAYFSAQRKADIYIGPNLFTKEEIEKLNEEEIFARIIKYFINDLKEKAPEQLEIDEGYLTIMHGEKPAE